MCARTIPERMFKIIYTTASILHTRLLLHTKLNIDVIRQVRHYESIMSTCTFTIEVAQARLFCRALITCYWTFENTHSSDTAAGYADTRSTFIFADTDSRRYLIYYD